MCNNEPNINLNQASFQMPIDDVLVLDSLFGGVIVTGHIEAGRIQTGASVMIVDRAGQIQISGIVNGIMSQSCIQTMEKNMLESASEEQDDYWGIALIFPDKKIASRARNGMIVVMP